MNSEEMIRAQKIEKIMQYVGETKEGWEDFTDWALPRIPLAWDVAQMTQTGPMLRSDKTFIELGRELCRAVETDMFKYVEENFDKLKHKVY